MNDAKKPVDVALIGGGVMSATLGAMIKQLEPDWSIEILEALDDVALESSNPWNNAGTGHSALCELNYTPEKADGMIDTTSAVKVNEQFQVSRQFWSYLVAEGALPEPDAFINSTPHMSFVWGDKNVEYLRKRHEALRDHPLFQGLEFSTDRERIAEWAPLLTAGRALGQPIAATRIAAGTDVDFGSLTRLLMTDLQSKGAVLELGHRVTDLTRRPDGGWRIAVRPTGGTARTIDARFVFVGAGGEPCTCCRSPASGRSRASAASRSAGSSSAPTTPPSSPGTRPRSTARRPSGRRRCRCLTSTPASSTGRRA
nr:hypothetical protein GCM10025699_45430 [Microbacterium flavescens]